MTAVGPTTGGTADAPDAQLLAAATEGCPSVARLHAGPAAAYLPGRRVAGVSVADDLITVHVDLAYPATVATLGAEVRAAVAGLLVGRRLAIAVDDVVLPGEPGTEDAPTRSDGDRVSPPTVTVPPSIPTGAQS